MKMALFACIATVLTLSCSPTEAAKAPPAEVQDHGETPKPKALQQAEQPKQADRPAVVVDVRSANEFRGGHAPNAIHIPYNEIGNRIADHVQSKEDKIILYCLSGYRAEVAKRALEKKGYTAVENVGTLADMRQWAQSKQGE
ncbi:MAG: rhodanese-like domain-containing protein [Victivallales bacterium]|jgi:phage shock protein E|nr:rhodanese-like domain-containing protein [Victivallales bacterium]